MRPIDIAAIICWLYLRFKWTVFRYTRFTIIFHGGFCGGKRFLTNDFINIGKYNILYNRYNEKYGIMLHENMGFHHSWFMTFSILFYCCGTGNGR